MSKTGTIKKSTKKSNKNNISVVSFGGSIVYPHYEDHQYGLAVPFLTQFREFILAQAKKGRRFIIVVGGGKICRMYQNATREIMGNKKSDLDLDWLGIQVTKVNALFIAKILREISFPQILDHEPGKKEVGAFLRSNKKVLAVAGWAPGWSTDYDAVQCARIFGVNEAIIAGDSSYICDKDPNKFEDAKPIKEINWTDYQKLIPSVWTPGLSTPIDPLAAKVAKKNDMTVKLIKGTDLENFRKAFDGEEFEGSIVRGK